MKTVSFISESGVEYTVNPNYIVAVQKYSYRGDTAYGIVISNVDSSVLNAKNIGIDSGNYESIIEQLKEI